MAQNNFTWQRILYTAAIVFPLLAIHFLNLNLVKFATETAEAEWFQIYSKGSGTFQSIPLALQTLTNVNC
jgi:hypothetical protein